MQSEFCTDCDIKKYWNLKPVKIGGQDEAQTSKWYQMIYYFICLPLLLLFRMAWKISGLKIYTFQQGIFPYHKENFSPILINTLGHLLLDTMYESPVWFTMIDNNISFNQRPLMVVQFYWFLYIENKHVKRGRENGDRHKLRNF